VCDDNVAAITDALPAPRTANVEMLSRARVTPEGLFQFILSGTPNQSFSVEKSEDLKTWNPLRDIRTDEFGNATIEDPADSANQSYRTIKN